MILKIVTLGALLGFIAAQDNVTSSSSSTTSSSACESHNFEGWGTIQSPNFPNNYPNNASCEVTIRTDPGTRIRLTFKAFGIERASGCRYDALVIRDGDSSFSPRIRKMCGTSLPGPIVSSGNALFLEFSTDVSDTSEGFRIEWSAVNTSSGWNDTVNCGGDLVGNNGTLTSPNYPSNYPNSARCVWTITTDPGTRVRLTFNNFQLEGSTGCIFDSLMIVDGNSILQKLCTQSLPDAVESSGNSLYLEFRSDMSVSLEGFSVRWTAVEDSAKQNQSNSKERGRGRLIRE